MTPPKYNILRADTEVELVRMVNEAQEHGWRPQGGVCVHVESKARHVTIHTVTRWEAATYLQAMVKEPCVHVPICGAGGCPAPLYCIKRGDCALKART